MIYDLPDDALQGVPKIGRSIYIMYEKFATRRNSNPQSIAATALNTWVALTLEHPAPAVTQVYRSYTTFNKDRYG